MSTRCQVIVKDRYSEIWFYRHSDGYPEGVAETLNQFLQYVKDGKIRDNAEQAAGWLIIIGHKEYMEQMPDYYKDEPTGTESFAGWKVGAYEPSVSKEHGDIEYLYTVDLERKEITYIKIGDRKTIKKLEAN